MKKRYKIPLFLLLSFVIWLCYANNEQYKYPDSLELHDVLGTSDKPLNTYTQEELCPGNALLEGINRGAR